MADVPPAHRLFIPVRVLRDAVDVTVLLSITDSTLPVDRGGYFVGGQFSNVVAVSWTQTDSFSDVTIHADLAGQGPSFDSGTAYLMTAAGPGTTALSEVVAPASFTVPTVAFAPGLYSGPPTVRSRISR